MILSHFPSSILTQILSYEDASYLVLTLLQVGDSLLYKKLVSSVTYVSLKGSKSSPKTLPSLLFQLAHLQELELYSPSTILESRVAWHPLLVQLPRSLQSLTIRSLDAFYSVINYEPSLNWSIVYTEYPRGRSRLIDLVALFPQLHTLKLLNFDVDIVSVESGDLAALPSTLTTLALPPLYLNAESSRYLPESLTRAEMTLILSETTNRDDVVTSAARSHQGLQYIEDIWYDTNSTEYCFNWLPETTEIGRLVSEEWNPELARVVRSKVRKIHLPSIHHATIMTSLIQALPASLEAIYVGPNGAIEFGVELSKLPGSLKSIEILNTITFNWSDIRELTKVELTKNRNFNFWPANLQTLHVPSSSITVPYLDLLPKTLKSLKIRVVRESSKSESDPLILKGNKFPPTLTDLQLVMVRSRGIFQIISKLPKTLRYLRIGDPGVPLKTDRQTIETTLPDTLLTLELPTVHLESLRNGACIKYPSHLTQLDVFTMPRNAFKILPRSLTSLTIFWLNTELEAPCNDLYEDLPPALRMLKITALMNDANIPYGEKCFSKLRCLERLECGGSYPSGVVRSLAPSLWDLCLNLDSLTQEDLPFLPKKLLIIKLGTSIQWSELRDAVNYWPPNALDCMPEALQNLPSSAVLWT